MRIVTELDPELAARLTWSGDPPEQLLPVVETAGSGEATVRFYTFTGYVQERVVCHRDIYRGGVCIDQARAVVATDWAGFIY